jgi:hypothetical protein
MYNKYLKYKIKYLLKKNMIGGSIPIYFYYPFKYEDTIYNINIPLIENNILYFTPGLMVLGNIYGINIVYKFLVKYEETIENCINNYKINIYNNHYYIKHINSRDSSEYIYFTIEERKIIFKTYDNEIITDTIECDKIFEEFNSSINKCLIENSKFYVSINVTISRHIGHMIFVCIEKNIITIYEKDYETAEYKCIIFNFFKLFIDNLVLNDIYNTCNLDLTIQNSVNEFIDGEDILDIKEEYVKLDNKHYIGITNENLLCDYILNNVFIDNFDIIKNINIKYKHDIYYNIIKSCATYSFIFLIFNLCNPKINYDIILIFLNSLDKIIIIKLILFYQKYLYNLLKEYIDSTYHEKKIDRYNLNLKHYIEFEKDEEIPELKNMNTNIFQPEQIHKIV